MTSAARLIERLTMTPSGVGGWFAPAMKSAESIPASALPSRFAGEHTLYTSNWYLLPAEEVLQLHQLKQDELWFFHLGSPIDLHVFEGDEYSRITLGDDRDTGQSYHAAAPHSTWFGAELAGPGFALVSCSLSPGYHPSDSAKPTQAEAQGLLDRFPERKNLIRRLAHQALPESTNDRDCQGV